MAQGIREVGAWLSNEIATENKSHVVIPQPIIVPGTVMPQIA
jgi:hypothetical protein